MTRPSSVRAPRGAAGFCRDPRRGPRGRRAGWVRPFKRANRDLEASLRLVESTFRTYFASECGAVPRPIGTSRNLQAATNVMSIASARLTRAMQELAAANECAGLQPVSAELLSEATERWGALTRILAGTAEQVSGLQKAVLDGLEKGELVPERPAERRPRIVLGPRPVPGRAFLRARQPRVGDRISPVLRRRRRTPRPAAVSVPRRSSQGRAPPFFPVCLL